MAGEWAVGVPTAAVGALAGPLLAALTCTLPGDGRLMVPGTWRGAGASGRRTALVTGLAALTAGWLGLAIGAEPALVPFVLLGLAGVVLAVVDVDCHRLPDRLVLPLYPVGVLGLFVAALIAGDVGRWVEVVLTGAGVLAVFTVVVLAVPSGLGLGDAKLAGLLALHLGWFGWDRAVLGLLVGFVLGAVAALVLQLARRVDLRTPIAFGPALVAGWLLVVVSSGSPA